MKVVVWLSEGTWQATVDAAREFTDGEFTLLHVLDPATAEALAGPAAGLLGRGGSGGGWGRGREVDAGGRQDPAAVEGALVAAQAALLDAAAQRLDRPARRQPRRGRPEREVVAACADAALLVLARDGDHSRLGPHSLGRYTRFVVDHAPCRVLLVWPDEPPDLTTIPPPPPPGHHPPPPPPPPGG